MQVKPEYETYFLIRYSRRNDVQTTEVVDTDEQTLKSAILTSISDKFRRASSNPTNVMIPWTLVKLFKVDNATHQSKLVCSFPKAYNLSPRETRIRVEKTINKPAAK